MRRRLRQSMGEGVDYLARPSEDMAQGVIELHDRDGHPLMIEASTSWAYVGPGLRIGIEVLGPEYSMKLDTLSTGLQLFFSRSSRVRPARIWWKSRTLNRACCR